MWKNVMLFLQLEIWFHVVEQNCCYIFNIREEHVNLSKFVEIKESSGRFHTLQNLDSCVS